MTTVLRLIPLVLVFLVQPGYAVEADDRALQKQRIEAQRERQQQVNERNRDINTARRDFRAFAQELKRDYREQVKSLDTESELRRVDIKADHEARIANADAAYQSQVMALYMNPGGAGTPPGPEQLSADAKAHADTIHSLKKQFAEALHAEAMATEKQKNALWSEMDQKALEEAGNLGLTGAYQPILASPIGGELTAQEEQWNKRENKAVADHEKQNGKLLAEFRNGAKLRQWELDNKDEDFKLTWQEKDKVHALDAEHAVLNSMLIGAAQGGQADQQQWMKQLQEIGEKKRAISTEFRKIRDRNRIERREKRKAILAE